MSDADRERWDARYAQRGEQPSAPIAWLDAVAPHLPPAGRALDLAGGDGRNALWLARRGLDVTLVDVSSVALGRARRFAEAEGLSLHTLALDLDHGPPAGPWAVVLSCHFLDRAAWAGAAAALAPGGLFVLEHQTRRNLERNAHPSARFLVEEGELPGLMAAAGLAAVAVEEGWVDGQHLVRGLWRRP